MKRHKPVAKKELLRIASDSSTARAHDGRPNEKAGNEYSQHYGIQAKGDAVSPSLSVGFSAQRGNHGLGPMLPAQRARRVRIHRGIQEERTSKTLGDRAHVLESEPRHGQPGIHLRAALIVGGIVAACVVLPARADFNAKECFFAGCAVGDQVVTTPTAKSGPSCASQGLTIYAFYLTHPTLPEGEDRNRIETQLRLQAGLRATDDPMKQCHATPVGQRANIVEIGAAKTGLLQVKPLDGSAPYWVSNFDVSLP